MFTQVSIPDRSTLAQVPYQAKVRSVFHIRERYACSAFHIRQRYARSLFHIRQRYARFVHSAFHGKHVEIRSFHLLSDFTRNHRA